MPIISYPIPQPTFVPVYNVYVSKGDKHDVSQYELKYTINTNRIELVDLEQETDYWVSIAEVGYWGDIGAWSEPVKVTTLGDGSYAILISEDGNVNPDTFKRYETTRNKSIKLKGLKDNAVYWVSIAFLEASGELGAFSTPTKFITKPNLDGTYEILVSEIGNTTLDNFKPVMLTTNDNYNEKENYYKATITGLRSGVKYWTTLRAVTVDGTVGSPARDKDFITTDTLGTTTIHISKDNIVYEQVGEVHQANYFRFKNLDTNTLYYGYLQVKDYNGENKAVDVRSQIFTFTTGDDPSPVLLVPYDTINYDTHILENSVQISTDNQLVVNQVNLTYYNRHGLLNRNDFLNDSNELEYVKYKSEYDVSGYQVIKRTQDENGNYSYSYNILENFSIDDDVNKVKINEMVSLVDVTTNYEILGKIVDIDVVWKTISVYLGYEVDRALQVFGKTEFLYNYGFRFPRDFKLRVGRTELPIICKYAREINNEAKTEFLKFPLVPHIDYEFYLKFSVPTSSLYNFSKLIEEIDNIYGTFDSTTFGYGERSKQKVPLYINSNRIELKGDTKEENYITYNTFDNQYLKLKVELADDNESDLKCTFINTINKTYPVVEEYPISTQGTILRVDDINKFNVGDCLMLHEDNKDNPLVKDYYNYNSNNRYTVQSIFKEDKKDYVVLDGIYPIGNENEQLKYIKYDYREVIHLQNFYIRGNPVVEEEEFNLYENQESIEAYGTKSIDVTGKIVKREDLSKIVDYYMKGFNGLDEEGIKFVFPLEIVGGLYDIKPLDIIEIEEPVYTGLSKQLMLVVSKKVRRAVNGERNVDRSETYELFPISGVNAFNDKVVKTIPRQDYEIVQKEFNAGFDENDKIIEFTSQDFGIIKVERIELSDYKANVQATINGDGTTLIIKDIAGSRADYNPLINRRSRIVVRVGNEFLLVEGQLIINAGTTSQTFKIIQRDLFKTGLTQISVNQDVMFYKFI